MIRQFLIITIIFFMNLPAFADIFEHPQKLSYIVQNIPEFSSIKCKFEQEKILPETNVTLKSSGDFEFIKDRGVIFKTTFPIQSETNYSTDGYKQINDIINAISNKNYEKLEAVFDFYFVKQGTKWSLGLTPKKMKQPSKYIKSIEIDGEKNISMMKITTQNSVITKIRFY